MARRVEIRSKQPASSTDQTRRPEDETCGDNARTQRPATTSIDDRFQTTQGVQAGEKATGYASGSSSKGACHVTAGKIQSLVLRFKSAGSGRGEGSTGSVSIFILLPGETHFFLRRLIQSRNGCPTTNFLVSTQALMPKLEKLGFDPGIRGVQSKPLLMPW